MYGAGQGAKNVVFLTVGTGIGGAVVIDGKLFNGFANRGTELGHVPLSLMVNLAHAVPWDAWSIMHPLRHWYAVSANVPLKPVSHSRVKTSTESLSYAFIKKETNWRQSVWTSIVIFWTWYCRVHQHLQPATHRNRWRTVRSR